MVSSERKGKRKADDHGEPLLQALSGGKSEHTKRHRLSYEVDDNQNRLASRPTKNAWRRARVNVTAAATAEELEVPISGANVEEPSKSSAAALHVSQNGLDVMTAPTRKLQKPRKSRAKNKDAHTSRTRTPNNAIDQPIGDAPPYAPLSNLSAGVATSNSKFINTLSIHHQLTSHRRPQQRRSSCYNESKEYSGLYTTLKPAQKSISVRPAQCCSN
jgi:hypothetical protein